MEAIVLAGGLGTRLASRLEGIPKALAPVAGRPFLQILLGQLQRAGVTRVLLSVGHLHHTIESRFGSSFNGLHLDYVIEQSPLGTGGAIRAALAHVAEPAALILNGDTYLQADYAAMMAFHLAQQAQITLAVCAQPDISRYGEVVVQNHRVTGFEEKGRSGAGLINAGAYIFPCGLAWPTHLAQKFSIESDFLQPEIASRHVAAFQVNGFFLDIGIPADLDRAQSALANI
jgi:D-glycero-alpha-D-manno-heptose 1-phosphate guanylyltransferase